MKLLKWIVVIFTPPLLISCVEFSHPLSAPDSAQYDPSIVGLWQGVDADNKNVFIHIGRSLKRNSNLMSAIQIEHRLDGKIDSMSVEMFPTALNNIQYMNISPVIPGQVTKSYYIFKYELAAPSSMKICTPEFSLFEKSVRQSKFKGDVSGNRVDITDSTLKLVELFGDKGAERFFTSCSAFKKRTL